MASKTEVSIMDDIIEYAADSARMKVDITLAQRGELCESAIERVLLAALVAVIEVEEGCPLRIIPAEIALDERVGILCLSCQVKIEDYRVDFLLIDSRLKRPLPIVIECDGHDFHERTKDQALRDRSRDRAVQAMGAMMFRFTGREIWRDPIKCAREVFELLETHARAEEREHSTL
jgi:very-short-patch-repair endonuclease